MFYGVLNITETESFFPICVRAGTFNVRLFLQRNFEYEQKCETNK